MDRKQTPGVEELLAALEPIEPPPAVERALRRRLRRRGALRILPAALLATLALAGMQLGLACWLEPRLGPAAPAVASIVITLYLSACTVASLPLIAAARRRAGVPEPLPLTGGQ